MPDEPAQSLPDQSEMRWAIKPERLVSPLNGAEITMGIAYGPVLDVETMVCPVAELVEARAQRDDRAFDAELKVSVMREAAARLKPLARRALTEPGASGDQARRDLKEAIDWIAKGCPRLASDDERVSRSANFPQTPTPEEGR